MPTDTTIIDRLRKIASANVCDLPNMGDEAYEPPEITWGELDEIGRTAEEAADALTAAHVALANLPGHTCHVSGDTCGGCEYAWERDKRISAAHAARDAAERELAHARRLADSWRAEYNRVVRPCSS